MHGPEPLGRREPHDAGNEVARNVRTQPLVVIERDRALRRSDR